MDQGLTGAVAGIGGIIVSLLVAFFNARHNRLQEERLAREGARVANRDEMEQATDRLRLAAAENDRVLKMLAIERDAAIERARLAQETAIAAQRQAQETREELAHVRQEARETERQHKAIQAAYADMGKKYLRVRRAYDVLAQVVHLRVNDARLPPLGIEIIDDLRKIMEEEDGFTALTFEEELSK